MEEFSADISKPMQRFRLVTGNKTYSSWSMRAWLAVKIAANESEVDEIKIPLAGKNATPERKLEVKQYLLEYSPTGKVPALIDREWGVTVYDSFAIMLHIADLYPQAQLLPSHPAARALCYAACSEMHSGFEALRTHWPMNCLATSDGAKNHGRKTLVDHPAIQQDLARLAELWTSLRVNTYSLGSSCTISGGDGDSSAVIGGSAGRSPRYLFGDCFTLADCMFAPIALRLRSYDPALSSLASYPDAQLYVKNLQSYLLVQQWVEGAEQEAAESSDWHIDSYDNIAK